MPQRAPDRARGFVLVQFPNAALWTFIAASVLAHVLSGWSQDWSRAVARIALTIWAYDEAARGVNWFRRGLGVAVLVWLTARLAHDLG